MADSDSNAKVNGMQNLGTVTGSIIPSTVRGNLQVPDKVQITLIDPSTKEIGMQNSRVVNGSKIESTTNADLYTSHKDQTT